MFDKTLFNQFINFASICEVTNQHVEEDLEVSIRAKYSHCIAPYS